MWEPCWSLWSRAAGTLTTRRDTIWGPMTLLLTTGFSPRLAWLCCSRRSTRFKFNLGHTPFLFNVFLYALGSKEEAKNFDPDAIDEDDDLFWKKQYDPSPPPPAPAQPQPQT